VTASEATALQFHVASFEGPDDPRELGAVLERLRAHPEEEKQLRKAARITARQYAWTEIVKRVLLPRLELLRGPRGTAQA
jgi:hypothetical protein